MGLVSYNPEQTDFGEDIKKLAEIVREKTPEEIEEEKRERKLMQIEMGIEEDETEEGEEDVIEKYALNFDAVFIPDYYRNLALLTPQLAYHDIKEITLLGSNGWNNSYLIDKAYRYVRGAILCDEFFVGSEKSEVQDFVKSYVDAYNTDPTVVSAQSYEALLFILESIEAGYSSSEGIMQSFLSGRKFKGIAGPVSINSKGIAWRQPFYLTITSRGFRELNYPRSESD